jgi:RNA recognition motif-containing protein
MSSIPRGPPRKPKQSGHALWVGNLPPGSTVIALKEHFSREATKDIESLFLISKSNCAFVNYRTETSCTAAMHRFHDSRFNGVRLVCRLRRSSTLASGVPTGPSAMMGTQQSNPSPPNSPKIDGESADNVMERVAEPSIQQSNDEAVAAAPITTNKYFIVKSLTLQDLELSVRNGIWATQSHNEDVLNKAFRVSAIPFGAVVVCVDANAIQSAENVYLIFSANKSGEYFGYARMASPILEEGPELTGTSTETENIADAPDVPKSISTPATEWAPKGRIIDDSARGTIFWEAELSESEAEASVDGDSAVVAQSWGKPFRVEWLSANRLPFYRTRGLRNPWNANREVKIARDGTELEPSVGDRLIQMFHRMGPASTGVHMMGPAIPIMRSF